MPAYDDPETLIVNWLADTLPAGPHEDFRRVVTEIPPDLFANVDNLPAVLVERFGGNDPHPGLDIVRLAVDDFCTGPDPIQARKAAIDRGNDIRRHMVLNLANQRLGDDGPWVSKVRVDQAPTIRPYDTSGAIRRAHAAYSLWLHRPI